MKPDIEFIRGQFPSLAGDWVYFDNAGGTQTAKQVIDRITDYLLNTNVQHGATYEISELATQRIAESQKTWAEIVNASFPEEIIFGSSTTQLLRNLAKSFVRLFKPGDEVIVTDLDHEANIGPWVEMEGAGIRVKTWHINMETMQLELEDLRHLITGRTRLVAFTHASNVVGMINPAKEITEFIHKQGALVCIDGVAYAPHRLPDMKELDADFYVFSLYKIFGPHYSLLYGKKHYLENLPGINHYFIENEDIPYKLQPGNVNFELTYGLLGIYDYFKVIHSRHFINDNCGVRATASKVYELFSRHEEILAKRFLDFLVSGKKVRILGEMSGIREKRVPTISFVIPGRKSSEIPLRVDPHRIGIRWGDFYARRLIKNLGLTGSDGVVRVSMVHYNTLEEVEKLISVLDHVI